MHQESGLTFFPRTALGKKKPLPYSRLFEIFKRKEHWQWH